MPRQFNMTIDDDLLKAAKRHALEHGTTVSELARAALAQAVGYSSPGADALAAYSAGKISRHEAMRVLRLRYDALLEALAVRGLPVPVLPDAEVRRMAETFTRIWTGSPDIEGAPPSRVPAR